MIKEKSILEEKFGNNVLVNENLAKYNWFNLGGNADIFFKPENEVQLIQFIKTIHNLQINFHILGAGSNTLIRDRGIRGSVIKLGSKFASIKLIEEDKIEVGAGILDKKVSDFATQNMIGGLEFLSCIPGSIGGAITMNSGCYGYEISEALESIKVLDERGTTQKIFKDNIKFHYRGTNLPKNYVIVSAILKGKKTLSSLVKKKQLELIEKKKNTQPSRVKTCGSTFKNTKEKKAWQIIKDAGCEKFSVGDASISEQHCNFFVNNGSAKSADIENLINKVKEQVLNKTGINLELEIKIIGNE